MPTPALYSCTATCILQGYWWVGGMNIRAFIGFIHFVYVSAISSLKSKSTALGKNYGEFLLSYAIGSTNYLLVSEGGINLGIDIYKVTSTTVTKEQTHSLLATATYYGYAGFAQDGTNLFVIGGSSNNVHSIYAYTLSSLSSGTISSLSAPFTLNGLSSRPSISATYSSSTGYVALGGGQQGFGLQIHFVAHILRRNFLDVILRSIDCVWR